MTIVTPPTVTLLAEGSDYTAKQMQARSGDLLPKHTASRESILFVHEGECMLNIGGEERPLKPGDAFAIPADVVHQITAGTDFRGIHFMPRDIEFQFCK